jgi:hypothetical protein
MPINFNQLYEKSDRFEYIITDKNRHLFRDGDLIVPDFDHDRNAEKDYRTVFGPIFNSNHCPLECGDRGSIAALRRMTQVRKPDIPGLHVRLETNQNNVRDHLGQRLIDYIRHVRHEFFTRLSVKSREEWYREWINTAMPKKRMRLEANDLIVHHGRDVEFCSSVKYKPKTGELLPPNKYPRGVADIGVHGCTRAAFLIPPFKESIRHYDIPGEFLYIFVPKPNENDLIDAFISILRPEYKVVIVCYSDDSMISIRGDDGNHKPYNMDVSCCDGSNFEPIFDILFEMMSVESTVQRDVDGVFKQLEKKLKIQVDGYNVKLQGKCKSLFSGSSLTTVTNCLDNLLIGLSILKGVNDRRGRTDSVLVADCAADVGFLVKLLVVNRMEDLQFLKHSPCFKEDGSIGVVLNLGVFLRTCGIAKYDIPGKRDNRYSEYLSEVVRSYSHAGDCEFYNAMRKRFILAVRRELRGVHSLEDRGVSSGKLDDESVIARYAISRVEYDELIELILRSEIGVHYQSTIVDKILEKDYG